MNRADMIRVLMDTPLHVQLGVIDYPDIHMNEEAAGRCADRLIAAAGDEDAVFRVRRDAPETSKAIVDKIKDGTLQAVMLYLFNVERHPDAFWMGQGWTDDELEVRTGRTHQSVSATRNTLMRKGYVVDSGDRRKTRSGNDAIVYVWTGKEQVQ